MNAIVSHLARCFIAGIVALLPVGGLIATVAYLETTIAKSGLSDRPFYFPGLGLLVVVVSVYIIGLTVSTFLGRWLWRSVDRLLDRLPALGMLYRTLKQVLGYSSGEDALFLGVVAIPGIHGGGAELGLITEKLPAASGVEDSLMVFIPGAPNPAAGRLVRLAKKSVQELDMPVSEAIKVLVSLGKTGLPGLLDSTGRVMMNGGASRP